MVCSKTSLSDPVLVAFQAWEGRSKIYKRPPPLDTIPGWARPSLKLTEEEPGSTRGRIGLAIWSL